MKKGFTLVELLVVIVILSVLAVMIVPRIQGIIYDSQEESYKLLVIRLENTANDYVTDNNLTSQIKASTPLDVYLYQLINADYIEQADLVDPRGSGKTLDSNNSYIRFTLENGSVVYTANIVVQE
ncbi:MAG: type II secretion system protein [Bacilli bacterium]|jgi:prepilin-type N-terminal cleavage/methylation domain-containing protein